MNLPEKRDAQFVLRVWMEPHDAVLRGRLVGIDDEQSAAGRGVDDLVGLVRQALERVERQMRAGHGFGPEEPSTDR